MRVLFLQLLRAKKIIIFTLFIIIILIISLMSYKDKIERKIFEIKIDPYVHVRNYTLSLSPPRPCPIGTKIVILIVSSNSHFSKRRDIRGSWGMEISQRKDTRYYFILGLGSTAINDQVEWESHTFADIIRYDFVDTYYNLTLKSVSLLKWADSHCTNANYVIKIDDDITLNTTAISELTEKENDDFLHGTLITGNKRLRAYWHKYFVPKEEFPEEIFPDYVAGACYMMSLSVVSKLLNASRTIPYVRMEDVFITGICREAAGLSLYKGEDIESCW